ncbi:response regulator [Xanthocytophaga flava]|uniref:response regulator n=1 Tax=Xanthocytophaga flava TaxID=3048013 RepID=UPI0028D3CC63|nr:response regulator [Xanthocytophaga flavus]MDJ1470180.1 response regulator [Xanthocytophaga flavus]
MAQHNFSVLIAEDDKDDIYLLKSLLDEHFPDWDYQFVTTGEAVLTYLANRTATYRTATYRTATYRTATYPFMDVAPIDVLLLDIHLPRLNGLQVLEAIRETPAYDSLAVIGYSADEEYQTIERFMKLGANAYLNKSNTHEGVINMLDKLPELVEWINQPLAKNKEY